MNENVKICDIIPQFVEIFKKMISTERINHMAVALGYQSEIEITEEKKLENMSMSDFEKLKSENPERNLKISNVISENDCEVVEITTKKVKQEKEEFIVRYLINKLAEEWKNLALKGKTILEQQKLEKEFNNIII